MGVDIQCGAAGDMADDGRKSLDVHTVLQGRCGESMPQIVESQVRESGLDQQFFHPVVAAAGHDRILRMEGVGEDPLRDRRSLSLCQELYRAGR